MLAEGDLELYPLSADGAGVLIKKARTHHGTAGKLARADPEIAMDALHAGNRKAPDAVLLARGLRATKKGGHQAAVEGVRAMLGGNAGILRVYGVVRRARHEGDYENAEVDVHPEDIEDNLRDSMALVDACEKAIALLPPFVRGRR